MNPTFVFLVVLFLNTLDYRIELSDNPLLKWFHILCSKSSPLKEAYPIVLVRNFQAKYIFDVSSITECDNGEPFINVDMNNFNIINQEDGDLFYNGSITYRKEYRSPWKVIKLSSKHLQRGTWQPGIINKEMADFCTAIRNPMETTLYIVMKKLGKLCPFEAGFELEFHMLSMGSFGIVVPPSFVGDWKFYVDMWIPRDGQLDHECYILPATVYEV